MRISACLALLSLLAAPAWAQSASGPVAPASDKPPAAAPRKMDLPAYLQQPEHQEAVVSVAKAQLKQVASACPNPVIKPTGQLTLLDPFRAAEGKPYAGAWSERLESTGCGPVRSLNVLTVLRQDGTPQIVGLMPGDTHTDPMMQKNALQYAQAVAARAAPPSCKTLAFVDTKFDGFSGLPNPEVTDGRESRPWREIWTLSACGTLFDINLMFTPNARGTALAGENPVKHPG